MSQHTVCHRDIALCLEQPSDAEPTLGERVAALQLEERRRAAALAGEVEEPQDEDSQAADEGEVPLKAIKADSLAVLLTQVRSGCASSWPLPGLQGNRMLQTIGRVHAPVGSESTVPAIWGSHAQNSKPLSPLAGAAQRGQGAAGALPGGQLPRHHRQHRQPAAGALKLPSLPPSAQPQLAS
jgi:hypothetical protein